MAEQRKISMLLKRLVCSFLRRSFKNLKLSGCVFTGYMVWSAQWHENVKVPGLNSRLNSPFHSSWKVTKLLHETEAKVDLLQLHTLCSSLYYNENKNKNRTDYFSTTTIIAILITPETTTRMRNIPVSSESSSRFEWLWICTTKSSTRVVQHHSNPHYHTSSSTNPYSVHSCHLACCHCPGLEWRIYGYSGCEVGERFHKWHPQCSPNTSSWSSDIYQSCLRLGSLSISHIRDGIHLPSGQFGTPFPLRQSGGGCCRFRATTHRWRHQIPAGTRPRPCWSSEWMETGDVGTQSTPHRRGLVTIDDDDSQVVGFDIIHSVGGAQVF